MEVAFERRDLPICVKTIYDLVLATLISKGVVESMEILRLSLKHTEDQDLVRHKQPLTNAITSLYHALSCLERAQTMLEEHIQAATLRISKK